MRETTTKTPKLSEIKAEVKAREAMTRELNPSVNLRELRAEIAAFIFSAIKSGWVGKKCGWFTDIEGAA